MEEENGWKMIISNKISIHFENYMKNRVKIVCLSKPNYLLKISDVRYRAVELSYCQSIGMSVHRYASEGSR